MKIRLFPQPHNLYQIYRTIKAGKHLFISYRFWHDHKHEAGIRITWGSSLKQARAKQMRWNVKKIF